MPNGPPNSDKVVLTDPRAIRALAHPARLAIIEALRPGEELTATELASVTGLSPSATSYHLKALAKWGIVEAGQARTDGRDRPWKAVGNSIEVNSSAPASTALAEAAILGTFLDRNRAIALEFLEQEENEPQEWRDTAELAASDYWLTAEELRKASREIRDVLAPYKERRPDSRPASSRRVRIARIVVPWAGSASSPRSRPAGPGGEPGHGVSPGPQPAP
jgi:DNA-binding transcriptional ArsR family regulator